MTDVQGQVDRLEAWVDGSAICVIAVSAFGDPLDLGEDEVEAFIEQLRACLVKVRAE
jgi:Fe2+ transport system protein FeoA